MHGDPSIEKADAGLWKLRMLLNDLLSRFQNNGKPQGSQDPDPKVIIMRSKQDHTKTFLFVDNYASMEETYQSLVRIEINTSLSRLNEETSMWAVERMGPDANNSTSGEA